MERILLSLLFSTAAVVVCVAQSAANTNPLTEALLRSASSSNRRSDLPTADLSGGGRPAYADYDYPDTSRYSPNPRLPPPPKSKSNTKNSLLTSDCRTKTRSMPHEKYCDLYYHTTGCQDSQSLLRSCPNGLLFTGNGKHGLIGVCDYPHNVECGGKEKHNPPISTDHCDWLYGIFGHETSCTRYWTCWNGTATEQFCVGGLLYNEDTHACDWPQNVGGCQKHPLCKDDANGNVPLGKSCNRYWACQGGYPRLQRCPAMLVFDKTRKRCVSPPTEDCDVPTTTIPPKDDNEDNRKNNEIRGGGGGGEGNRRRGGGGGGGGGDNQFQQRQQALPFPLSDGPILNRPPPPQN